MLNTYRPLLPLPSQMIAFVKLWRYPCPTDSPNFFTPSDGLQGMVYPVKNNAPLLCPVHHAVQGSAAGLHSK